MPKTPRPSVTTIGSIEYIALPEVLLEGVPAKVDTGADSSAIWATNVRVEKGVLHYTLFDPTSPLYTGQALQTTEFTVSAVKNSFGHVESRYKVPMTIQLAGRAIRTRFTLANRSNNRFPILIGRRTLRGKFLVDVSRRQQRKVIEMLILTAQRSARIRNFITNLEKADKKLRVTLATYDELDFYVGEGQNRVVIADTGKDIARFDVVHFKVVPKQCMDLAGAAAQYLQRRGVQFIDRAVASFPGASKLYQYVVLQNNAIAVPRSVLVAPGRLESSYEVLAGAVGVPFVLKDMYSNRGQDNYLVADEKAFYAVCRKVVASEHHMIAQEFIDNDGDYRLLTMGGKVQLAIGRRRKDATTHLNNTSRGGEAWLAGPGEIPEDILKSSIRAAKLLGRDIAGVDMVKDKNDGSWYCLEVNNGPQIASGVYMPEKVAAYAHFIESELLN